MTGKRLAWGSNGVSNANGSGTVGAGTEGDSEASVAVGDEWVEGDECPLDAIARLVFMALVTNASEGDSGRVGELE
jgi:hypothetical protein